MLVRVSVVVVDAKTTTFEVVPSVVVNNIVVLVGRGELNAGSMVKTETIAPPGPVVSVVALVMVVLLGIVLSWIDAPCEVMYPLSVVDKEKFGVDSSIAVEIPILQPLK